MKGKNNTKNFYKDYANSNFRNQNVENPIHIAVYHDSTEAIADALKRGFDINTKGFGGNTILMRLAYRSPSDDNTKLAQFLLKNGADVNIEGNNREDSALNYAISNRNADLVLLFIAHGAKYDEVNRFGSTLLKSCLFNFPYPFGGQIVQRIISKGADVDTVTESSETLVYAAYNLRDFETVEFLIDRGADLKKVPKLYSQEYLLYRFVGENLHKILDLALSKNVDINVKANQYNNSSLIEHKVYVGAVESLKIILKHYPEVDVFKYKDNNDRSLLYIAIKSRYPSKEMLDYFLKSKEAKNYSQKDLLDYLEEAIYSVNVDA